ncbi:hypothetical protein LIA77_03822 [Sarocladium implicatum]|nr:hypothetical protein LIA77_03822 [Sarocladium implicatum]
MSLELWRSTTPRRLDQVQLRHICLEVYGILFASSSETRALITFEPHLLQSAKAACLNHLECNVCAFRWAGGLVLDSGTSFPVRKAGWQIARSERSRCLTDRRQSDRL